MDRYAILPESDPPRPLSPEPLQEDSPIVMEVTNISFAINRKEILRNISFFLRKGECLAIVGANGAGWGAYEKPVGPPQAGQP